MIVHLLIWCVVLSIMLTVGGFIITIIWGLFCLIVAGVFIAIQSVWNKVTGK